MHARTVSLAVFGVAMTFATVGEASASVNAVFAGAGARRSAVDIAPASDVHDWDWLVGSWKVRHHRLKARLVGSKDWEDFDGTCDNRPTFGGRGNADDNLIELPGGAYHGVGVRSLDAKSGLWSIWWLDSRNPAVDPPVRGTFKNGVGTFIGDGTQDGKPVKLRFRWSGITSTSANWEQAMSADGGVTWETNWTMEFSRVSAQPMTRANESRVGVVHDFDFLVGRWTVQHQRLKARLARTAEWDKFGGTLVNWPTLGGQGNAGDNVMELPGGTILGLGFRSFDAKTGLWSVWWLNSKTPSIDPPIHGSFKNGIGTFIGDDTLDGKPIKVRVLWSRITANSARWEQSYSGDGGKTWEVNWISDFTRARTK